MAGLTDVIDSSKKLLPLISEFAPALASALGTPLSGIVIGLIGHVFGVESGDVENIAQAIKLDPDAKNKLILLEDQHKEALAQIKSNNYAAEVQDREDARAHVADYKKFVQWMAVVVTIGFFSVLIFMFLPIAVNPNSTERELLSMLVGMLVSKWQTIIDFFYGSSSRQGGLQ